uniref:Peptidase C11 clostripain n=1 Tax=Burkholderia sp. (strain CCGE1003) TaxID=640512 RepID=E1THK4_BURSG
MRFHCLWRAGMALALSAALASCGGDIQSSSPGPAANNTTLMVYIVGSDLESEGGEASGNIADMLKAQLPAGSHVVIETGGAAAAGADDSHVKDWKDVQRHVIGQSGKLETVAHLGEIDMADSTALSDFIGWAHDTYPAAHYRLVLWNHGSGWSGYGYDENFSNDHFTLPTLTTALAVANARSGVHFDLIGFDACLMAAVEASDAISPYADYLLASEELEPGSGWDYTQVVRTLATDAVSYGKGIIDSYVERHSDTPTATLSLVDLSKVGAVRTALTSFTNAIAPIASDPQSWPALGAARRLAPSFGMNGARQHDEVDIAGFADLTARAGIALDASKALASAARAAVVYVKNGEAFPDAAGLSVYFPTASSLSSYLQTAYAQTHFDPAYIAFTGSYVAAVNALPHAISIDTSASVPGYLVAQIAADDAVASVDATLVSAVAADGTLTVAGTMPVIIPETVDDMLPRMTQRVPLSGNWLTLNGYPVIIGELARTGITNSGDTLYGIPLDVDGTAEYLVASRDAAGTWTLLGMTEDTSVNPFSPRLEPLPGPDAQIRTLAASYNITTQSFGDLSAASPAFSGGALTLAMTALPAGTYREGVLVTNLVQQAQMSSLVARP